MHKEEEKRFNAAIQNRNQELKNARSRGNEWRAKRGYDLFQDLTQYVFADHMMPMVLLALNTGLRQGELFNLQWENIDFDRAILTVTGDIAKSGKTRHVPLNTVALQVFKRLATAK